MGASGMQLAAVCIGSKQGKVAEWVVLMPIFEFCTREQGYERGGLQRKPWWQQEALDVILRVTLEEISQEERLRWIRSDTQYRAGSRAAGVDGQAGGDVGT